MAIPLAIPLVLPQLYVFAISHYCEKARWALDYLGVDYEIKYLAPGSHANILAGLGANGTSLPLLVRGKMLIQGSSEIIAWAETASGNGRTLTCGMSAMVTDIDNREDMIGVHVRRLYYSEALLEHPQTVLPIFADYLAGAEAAALREAWALIVSGMAELMDLGVEQGLGSREILIQQLDWFDTLLDDGRDYLQGNTFTRLDLSVASLLAALVEVSAHPTYVSLQIPPRLALDLTHWQTRPVIQFVARMYHRHRSE